MRRIDVEITERTPGGKGVARRTRAKGLLPIVVYGEKLDTEHFTVDSHSFEQAISTSGKRSFFNLKSGDKETLGIIKDMQVDPLTGQATHVDMMRIAMDHKMSFNVPIHLVGTPEGVRSQDGTLETIMRDVEIECMPDDVPEFFELEVRSLEVGQATHVRDIEVDETKFTIMTDDDQTVATVVGRKAEEEVEEEVVEGEEGAVEGEEGAEEGEEKKEDSAAK
jgi:large subunit ribosomal protein L25